MTNFNEKLDELMPCDCKFLKGFAWRKGDQCDGCINGRLKQAITSLIKELVAEAKPDDFLPKGYHPDACLNHVRYTSACCGCQKQRARNYAIDEFEQSLLKALEEK